MELVKENKEQILSALQRALQKEFDGTEQQEGAKELIKSIQNYGIYPIVPELELYCWDTYGKYGDDYSLYPDEDFGYFIVVFLKIICLTGFRGLQSWSKELMIDPKLCLRTKTGKRSNLDTLP